MATEDEQTMGTKDEQNQVLRFGSGLVRIPEDSGAAGVAGASCEQMDYVNYYGDAAYTPRGSIDRGLTLV